MKTIAIHTIGKESIFVVHLDDELKNIIKRGNEISIGLKNEHFEEGVILKIPFRTDSIKSYSLGTIYKSRFARDENICEPNFIQYLTFDEEERLEYAKNNKVDMNWFIDDKGIDLTNFSEDGYSDTAMLFENDCINFTCTKLDGEVKSETISCNLLL